MNGIRNSNVLVTGATGLIGSNLVKKLLDLNCNVIAAGRNIKKLQDVFGNELINSNLKLLECDILKKIPNLSLKVDYIFHAASPISGLEINSKPVDTIKANIFGLINCLDYIEYQGYGRLIVFSSATVYGNSYIKDIVVNENETNMAEALNSRSSVYSESKRMIEVLSQSYLSQYNVDSVIARIGYVYGYSYFMPKTAFYEFIDNAINGIDITINNSGMCRRDNIYIDDAVNGLVLIADVGKSGEVYNISSNGEKNNYISVDEIANIIADTAKCFNRNIKINVKNPSFNEERKPGIMLSNQKLKSLGWNVEYSIEDGIKETLYRYII